MTIQSTIMGIFPTPIYGSKLNRSLSKEELSFIDKNKMNVSWNEGNKTSNDNNILENEVFKNLKDDLYLRVKDYFDKIICSSNNITPYITQSWLNYTETNEFHHKHQHPNSLVSGVFYINCHEEYDKINFYNDSYKPIVLDVENFNLYNAENWWYPVKTGDIILFPSSLPHSVETKKGNNTRISLAFNVFVRGDIGNKEKLSYLKLL